MADTFTPDYASSLLEELIPEETRSAINEENPGDQLAKALRRKKLAKLLLKLIIDGQGMQEKEIEWGF